MRRSLGLRRLSWVAVALVCAGGARDALAQRAPSRLPTPPEALRSALVRADEQLQSGEVTAGIEMLQQILDHPEDHFASDSSESSFKAQVEQRLRTLSPEGRASYERRYGDQARVLCHTAVRTGDVDALQSVVRQFFWTEAGLDAAVLLAAHRLDAGDALAAARLQDRLLEHAAATGRRRQELLLRGGACWLQAGDRERALARLVELDQALRDGGRQVAGRPVPEFTSPPAALAWLADSFLAAVGPAQDAGGEGDVVVFRGDARRNAALEAAVPVGDGAWHYPAFDDYDTPAPDRAARLTEVLQELERQYAENERDCLLLPAQVPLITGNAVLFPGFGMLKAVSPDTGEFLWAATVGIDQSFRNLAGQRWEPNESWHQGMLKLFLGQRAWRDLTASAVSTDGRYAYALSDGGMVSSLMQYSAAMSNLSAHPMAPHPYNWLKAYELAAEGRLKWQAGGPRGTLDRPLAGAFFLGAPLPLEGRLYCLVEDGGQVRLAVLNAERSAMGPQPAVEWSQALYNPDRNLHNNMANAWQSVDRRLAGLTPAAAGGILVCPTGERTIIAVDVERRRVLWAHEYREAAASTQDQVAVVRMRQARQQSDEQMLRELLSGERWHDAAPIIAGNFVVVTPPDSPDVHCLRLLDGQEVWRSGRGDGLYVACVHGERVIVVGRNEVRALNLSDGGPAWPRPAPIPVPSGRGFRHGHLYVLPLSTGEIATVDLERGRVLVRSPLQDRRVPGNLVAAQGRIFSSSPAGLLGFRSLGELTSDVESRLAASPGDPHALALRGELRLHLGDESTGLSDLREAARRHDDPRARQVLTSALIEGLRTDFAAYRNDADEIDRLVTDPQQRSMFLRLLAEGLEAAGERTEAFRRYLEFAESGVGTPVLERVDSERSVRSDRIIRTRLEALYDAADAAERAGMNEALRVAAGRAAAAEGAGGLQRLLGLVEPLPIANAVRRSCAERLDPLSERVLLESLLLRLRDAPDPALHAEATARLADLHTRSGEPAAAYAYLRELGGDLAGVVCLEGRTGEQLLDAWRADPARALASEATWPVAHVEVDDVRRGSSQTLHRVEQVGPPSDVLRGWNFFIDVNGANVHAFDADGRPRGKIPTGSARGRKGQDYVRYVSTAGRLALVVLEDQFLVLDAIGEDGNPVPLAQGDLVDSAEYRQFPVQIFVRQANPQGRVLRQAPLNTYNRSLLGNAGPLNSTCLVYQQATTLKAINPLTGEELWVREDASMPVGCEILADDEFIVLWPPQRNEVILLRSSDGDLVGRRRLPAGLVQPQPECDWGRKLLTLTTGKSGAAPVTTFGLYDPVDDRNVWEYEVTELAAWSPVDGRDVAVLRRDGRLSIIDGATGDERCAATLSEGLPADRLGVITDADRSFVVTVGAERPLAKELRHSPNARLLPVHGTVAALERGSGRLAWSRPVEYQSIDPSHPSRWPALVFTALVYDTTQKDRNIAERTVLSTLLLDKTTGSVLYENQRPMASTAEQSWRAYPDEQRIELMYGSAVLGVQFAESPPQEK